ncbi:protein of unknown function [Acidithiobacillus ferrivorans]|uniref:Uncharacterized protein n=1 Tax=Acidithiobacillus ferrivorans TaxID=160808 RepID=A0A060UTG3_9PROT|nr:hypothetical protein AFERRI_600128 [Acidithiobacillus ferrivorans]SMH65456.1 protein of unknown function [Acidithiobacillus ferrivorans]
MSRDKTGTEVVVKIESEGRGLEEFSFDFD